MIEGFPRCANSFAVRAFRFANDPENSLKVATHIHSPAHIVLAIRWNIPTIVLIRHPDDAVLSKLAKSVEFEEEGLSSDKLTKADVEELVRYYTKRFVMFYDYLKPFAGKFVAADFYETTRDFSEILARVNALYKTEFSLFDHTAENVKKIFDNSDGHLSPSSIREHCKKLFQDQYLSNDNDAYRTDAIRAYNEFRQLNSID
ncbi:MAG: hypothetical protein SVR94_14220 [Pseudomonadota bacterium]|nr:hypothetical protein [Pseudomonadota bacterium]